MRTFFILSFFWLTLSHCSSSSDDKTSSEPVNHSEAEEYQREMVRCVKTGGSRLVKIVGRLYCY